MIELFDDEWLEHIAGLDELDEFSRQEMRRDPTLMLESLGFAIALDDSENYFTGKDFKKLAAEFIVRFLAELRQIVCESRDKELTKHRTALTDATIAGTAVFLTEHTD